MKPIPTTIPFEIVHCSSFDKEYEPGQLEITGPENDNEIFQSVNHHGWQTKKFPEYPQDLILQFKSGLCRISKIQILSHHYKIASQIEFFIGVTKEQGQDSMYIQFTRLGFVSLDNNDRFQDRELKSIKIQADCEYVRLVIKGCHENRLNVHKQVGLLALNILGYDVASNYTLTEHDPKQQRLNSIASLDEDHINLEQWIQAIQQAEEESAQDEYYKEAKIYKELGDRLTGLWRFITNLENDKQQAVLVKDYEEADKIKADMCQVRQTAQDLLKQSGIQITKEGDILPIDTVPDEYNAVCDISDEDDEDDRQSNTSEKDIVQNNEWIEQENTIEESKLENNNQTNQLLDEAIANWTSFDALSISNTKEGSPSLLSARIPITATPSVAGDTNLVKAEKDKPTVSQDPETVPEPLPQEDIENCEPAIKLFGEHIVACIMSVKVKCRQIGLQELKLLIEAQKKSPSTHESNLNFIQSSILMIQEAIMDSRESIFNQTIQTWKDLLDIIDTSNKQIYAWIEKFFNRLVMRTNDNNSTIKIAATNNVLELIDVYPSLTLVCFNKDQRMMRNLKDAKSRLDLVAILIKKVLVPQWEKDKTAKRDHILLFLTNYHKNHPHQNIRRIAWDLLILVAQYQDVKTINTYLEPNMIQSLEKELKKKNGVGSNRKLAKTNSSTVSELRALAVRSNNTSSKKLASNKFPNNDSSKRTAPNSKKTKENQTVVEEEATNTCIFCDEKNDAFNEDTIISHYYNQCPVLTECSVCKNVLEVSTLREHLQRECEKKHLLKKCTSCKLSIPVEQWPQHASKKNCIATVAQVGCPFCQKDMTKATETEWKSHLLKDCSKNPRRPKKQNK